MATEISDWNDLDNVRNDLTGDYVLVNDLDSETDGYDGIGDDFNPIGPELFDDNFQGTFDGQGNEIADLVVSVNQTGVGLFTGVGMGGDGTELIENLSVSGSVTDTGANGRAGGVAGRVDNGTIQNCVSHVDVTSDGDRVGGLVGFNGDTVTESYATGSVEGDERVGGLVGQNNDTVTESYATGSVEGVEDVGGLVGRNNDTIQTSYAVGLVTGDTTVGALVGRNELNDQLSDSYADEETTGQTDLTGDGLGSITNSETLTTAEMQGSEAETNMDGFDFSNVWSTVEAVESETINGQITLDDVATETATVILHNFSESDTLTGFSEDGYPILLNSDKGEQLDLQNIEIEEQINIARTETDTDGNYSADIPGATGDTIAVAVDFDDGTERYGRLITTVLE